MKKRMGAAFVILFFVAFGISVGAFTQVMMDTGQKEEIAGYLQSAMDDESRLETDHKAIFQKSLKENGGLMAIMLLGGLLVVGFPITIAALVFKCASIGFSSALLVEEKGLEGLGYIVTRLLAQNIIFLPVLALVAMMILDMSMGVVLSADQRIRGKRYKENIQFYLIIGSFGFLFIIFGSFVEAYLTPILFRLLFF